LNIIDYKNEKSKERMTYMPNHNFHELTGTHDIRLSPWGPYTKKYVGISHIPDIKKGIRFDLSVIPGFYRRKVDIPNVMWESGYHTWEASPDLDYYSYRYELEWKDKVYCDVSYTKLDDNVRLIRCEYVNNTDDEQNLVLHYMAYINFPRIHSYSSTLKEDIPEYYDIQVGQDTIWIDALDYTDLSYNTPRPTDNLVSDGLYRGEVRDAGFINGSGLGKGFGNEKGDRVTYSFTLDKNIPNALFMIRYRIEQGKAAEMIIEGLVNESLRLEGNGDFNTSIIQLGNMDAGKYEYTLISASTTPIEIDGFVIMPSSEVGQVNFVKKTYNLYPDIESYGNKGLIIKYEDVEDYYGIAWAFDLFEVREFYTDELDRFMRHKVHNHVSSVLKGEGNGHYTNVFLRPIYLKPNSRKIIYGMVCTGAQSCVKEKLEDFIKRTGSGEGIENYERIYKEKRDKALNMIETTPEGNKYLFSQQRMAATILSNIVYPVYIKRGYIRHYTPGRWWDSLYTWDSGFHGLGLSVFDVERAIDCLNAYVTEPGDTHAAFIHHGSPVPVQFYLFLELWNRTQSKELLQYFYPRLKQYYEFLAGKLGSSTTRQLKSNLLKTWDYFYNSGGWDDYPPQVYVHKNRLEKYVAPVITTSQCIRIAKILYMTASALGYMDDLSEYAEDIATFTQAIQEHCWDEEAGYFSYVCHDDDGYPYGILRDQNGVNYNMGLDGTYPLVAGICSKEQKERLLHSLMSDKHMWTDIGISTVDKSAPYYKVDGYWNGAVWMPHQWFIWKTMLDMGMGDFAYKIAKTGLDLWEREVSRTYHCFEHFIIQSGRGAGWHQFGGLSSPVLCWFEAYFRPGTLTFGFDVWAEEKRFSSCNTSLTAKLKYYGNEESINIIAVMNPDYKYRVKWNDSEARYKELLPGVLQIELSKIGSEGVLNIESMR